VPSDADVPLDAEGLPETESSPEVGLPEVGRSPETGADEDASFAGCSDEAPSEADDDGASVSLERGWSESEAALG